MENLNEIEIKDKEEQKNKSEKFIFLFETNIIDDTFYGFSLKTIVRVISIFTLMISITEFFDTLKNNTFLNLIYHLIISIAFLIITYYIFYSTIEINVNYAFLGYFIYSILWIFLLIKYLFQASLMLVGYLNPYENDFFRIKLLTYIFIEAFILGIYLYFVWILFCYYVNVKRGNIE